MVDLTPIKPYIIEDDSRTPGYAVSVISRIGFEEWFKSQLEIFCNCTKTFRDGRRCTQTNDMRYNYEITDCVLMIEQFGEYKKDEYYNQLLKQHQINLEFEAINCFDYEPHSNKKNKKPTTAPKKRNKQTSMDLGDKPKKETAAERKLKAHAIKLNAVTFKPKSVSNGDTL